MSPQAEIVAQHWGPEAPDWILHLARICGERSQSSVAKAMGYTPAVVSGVLRGKYAGDMSAVEDRFRGAFMDAVVRCPAKGDLPLNICRKWREKTRHFIATNPDRVRMYRACMRCPIHTENGEVR